jgi:hypothetical protein
MSHRHRLLLSFMFIATLIAASIGQSRAENDISSTALLTYIHSLDTYRQLRYYQDMPAFSDDDYRRIIAGKAQITYRDIAGSGLKKSLLGVILPISAEKLWLIVNDRNHFEYFFKGVTEAVILNRVGASVTTFQFLELPVVSNRYYVTTATVNLKLNQAAGGKMLESSWDAVTDPQPFIEAGLKNGSIKTTRQMLLKGVLIKRNFGAWLLTPLPNNRTLLEYYLFSDPDGSIPDFAINKATRRTMENVAKLFSTLSEAQFNQHFNAGHEAVFNPDGTLHNFHQ